MADEPMNGDAPAYEPDDVRGMTLLKVAAGLLVGLVVAMLVVLPWHREQTAAPSPSPAGPALLAHPVANLAAYRATQTRRLEGYGWVDREAGIAHIPVERAMQILSRQSSPEVAP